MVGNSQRSLGAALTVLVWVLAWALACSSLSGNDIPHPGAADRQPVPVPVTGEEDHSTGTLAHEYTHLVSYAVRVQGRPSDPKPEVLWLDEGIAHLMEDLSGWNGSNYDTIEVALGDPGAWVESGFL